MLSVVAPLRFTHSDITGLRYSVVPVRMKAISFVVTATLPLVFALPTRFFPVHYMISEPETVVNKTFDYIIAGGGLTGLTVASRLSEDPNISVLVIEGGNNDYDDPRVYDVRTYGEAFGSNLDYNLKTTSIPWRGGYEMPIVAGKTIGGSGSINGASWTKGPKTQYDILPDLIGNDSWAFDEFNKYMLATEHFSPPHPAEVEKGAKFDPKYHSDKGPVEVSFAQGMFANIQKPALDSSIKVWKGLRHVEDIASGIVNGVTIIPNMLQPDISQNRSTPYTAWILDRAGNRTNLVILTGHRVTCVVWQENTSANSTPIARGVEFQASPNTPSYFVAVNKEVIIATGALQSPQLLELSGVGNPAVLSAAGVPLVHALPSVGKNFQEQTKNSLVYKPKDSDFDGSGPPSAIAYPNVHQILGPNATTIHSDVKAALPAHIAQLERDGFVISAKATQLIIEKQIENLFNASEAAAEVFFTITPAEGTMGIDAWSLVPLSRGSVHIATKSSWDHPVINPNYFSGPLDLKLQTLIAMQSRQVYSTPPLSDLVEKEITPGFDVVPEGAGYKEWEKWVKDSFTSVWHPVATLSCMKEELGGVVDERLRVYGVKGVRVVDASVLPVQLSAHLSSSLYGIALKAAQMIKEDYH